MVMPVSSVPTPRRASRRTGTGLTGCWNRRVDNQPLVEDEAQRPARLLGLKPVVIERPWLPS
ncbi:protein of unknown function [Methylorubrum extorquens DM4]|uniref:Uncharacterized protein n=1 Tax=Methylorubrum extorquens (strain DSM 6343 / CIP 106787 / DM4) TaxID=661410 RepID=C7CHM3_METED|nr:protein of unknown function [Methylorubrum extorquens DM4]